MNNLYGAPIYFDSNSIESNNLNTNQLNETINNGLLPDISDISDNFDNILDNYNKSLYENDTDIIAIKGNYEKTQLSTIFFSSNNIQSIQESIRYYIYKTLNKIIDNQAVNELYIIMRSYLFQNGDQSLKNLQDIKIEISKLNILIINYCVNSISTQLNMYDKYINELENLRIPIDIPKYNNGKVNQLGHPYF
tara:strand:+ start:2153 stop:2731 length:579 start_codon:yes stop_codon:yes gene_type:complete